MWWAALMNGKNGTMFRTIIYVGLIVTFLVIFTIVMIHINKKNKAKNTDAAKIAEYEKEIVPTSVSLTDSQIENMASAIDTAIGTWSDDEETIYQQFMKLKTNSDLLKLQEIFGTRSSGHDLFTAIHRNLNTEEIQKINTILSERNITIKI